MRLFEISSTACATGGSMRFVREHCGKVSTPRAEYDHRRKHANTPYFYTVQHGNLAFSCFLFPRYNGARYEIIHFWTCRMTYEVLRNRIALQCISTVGRLLHFLFKPSMHAVAFVLAHVSSCKPKRTVSAAPATAVSVHGLALVPCLMTRRAAKTSMTIGTQLRSHQALFGQGVSFYRIDAGTPPSQADELGYETC